MTKRNNGLANQKKMGKRNRVKRILCGVCGIKKESWEAAWRHADSTHRDKADYLLECRRCSVIYHRSVGHSHAAAGEVVVDV